MWEFTFNRRPRVIMRLPSIEVDEATCSAKTFSFFTSPWNYRGEGNANLVIAVSDKREIVRLRKCSKEEATDEERIYRELEFCQGIMRPLLGEKFVHVPKVVRISPWELEWLTEKLSSLRPSHRHHKSVFAECGALFPDLCYLPNNSTSKFPTFCVEVKPKQGWIPQDDRRLPKCTFCLNQFLKLRNESVKEQSRYCPLDLFSGEPQRMAAAIQALIQCPQNNFKIFCNGTLQYGEANSSYLPVLMKWFGEYSRDGSLENLSHLILSALTYDFKIPAFLRAQDQRSVEHKQNRIPQALLQRAAQLLDEPTCFQSTNKLPPGCILERILQIQKLDEIGSDHVYHMYASQKPNDYDYVSQILCDPGLIYDPINAYLLATTAKDCSILIAFQQTSDSDSRQVVRDLNGTAFAFNIGVSDLDPKPMSCIEKHRRRDLEAVQSCIAYLEDSSCIT